MNMISKKIIQDAKNYDVADKEFSDGIIDMFLGFRAGHLGRYCFSSAQNPDDNVRGDEHWTQFIRTTAAYYPYADQIEIIRQHAPTIGFAVSDAETFVDLGTGSLNSFEHKVLPIVRSGSFNEMVFVDLCTTFSKLASNRLKEEGLALNTRTFIGNFFNEMPALSGKSVINLFGITLGNIIVDLPRQKPEEILAKTMQHFAAPLKKQGGYFIFDYDTNEDEASMHASYDHPAYHAMELTILDRVKRDLPTVGFEPNDFEHITVWYPQWNLLAQELRAKQAANFSICGHDFSVQEGQSFRTGSSFKYSDETVEEAANKAGFEKIDLYTVPNSTMRVAVYGI